MWYGSMMQRTPTDLRAASVAPPATPAPEPAPTPAGRSGAHRGAVHAPTHEARPHTRGRVPASAVRPEWCDEEGYPFRDVPLSNDTHLRQTLYAVTVLRTRYAGAAERVYVGGDLFIYYREGDRNAAVAPDAFVAFGASQAPDRTSWKVWREGRGPDWVLEVLSESTRKRDEVDKLAIYRELQVGEYWLFDPYTERRGGPALRGLKRAEDDWRSLRPDAAGVFRSDLLGLTLHVEGGDLRFRDAETGEALIAHAESIAALRDEAEAHRAEKNAHQAERQAHRRTRRRLAHEAAARREETTARRAEVEAHRTTRRQLAEEAAAREAAEARVAELKALLEGNRG